MNKDITSIIPLLEADDIEVRVLKIYAGKGVELSLYKDARCDMRMLDQTFGADGWQREHYECKGNLYCRIGIKFDDEWIWKSDCGTESFTEKEKGEASDSFKRAAVNWGFGRELYTAPFIFVPIDYVDTYEDKGKLKCKTKFTLTHIAYTDKRRISELIIVDTNKQSNIMYQYPRNKIKQAEPLNEEAKAKVESWKITEYKCVACGKDITKAEADYSQNKYQQMLCRKCQKVVEEQCQQ